MGDLIEQFELIKHMVQEQVDNDYLWDNDDVKFLCRELRRLHHLILSGQYTSSE